MIFSFKILSLSSIPHSPLIQMSQPDLGTYVPNTAFSQQPHLLKTPSKIYTFYKWLLVLKSCYPDLFLKFLKMTQPIRSAYHYHYCIQGIQNWLKKEQQLPLHPQMKSLFMAHPALPIKGTIVFFHGYSAGTWQFEHWATHFFNKGYNVFVPRLSGHGFQSAAHAETAQYLPQSQQWTVFQSFSNEILDLVKQFDAPLFLAGLSGGGAIATYSAACHSEVSKLVVFSPFFKPNTPVGKKVFDVVSFLERTLKFPIGKILDYIPWIMSTESQNKHAMPGHTYVSLGNIYALYRFGQCAIHHSSQIHIPILLFSSACDKTSDFTSILDFKNALSSWVCWYHFEIQDQVPHPMVHPKQHTNLQKINEMMEKVEKFLD